MIKFIFKIFVWIRNKLNRTKLPINKEKWNEVRNLKLSLYSNWVNTFPYVSDPLFGLLDKTETFEHFIDPNIKSGRDCDDFAEMYKLWGMFNGRVSYTVVVTTKTHPFKNSHLVTVLYNPSTNKYTLCNYTPTQVADSLEGAIDGVKQWSIYKEGYIYSIQCKTDPLTKEQITSWEKG